MEMTPIPRGTYVGNEWLEAYGLKLAASGGLGELPRIFDTANPGSNRYGDPDLGSPNEKCTPSGPGTGIGGEPGAPGENCDPLGNVLIIQENNKKPEIPDDNVDGGMIRFIFTEPLEYVYEMGLIDIDYESSITVFSKTETKTIQINDSLGDNAVQAVPINMANVLEIKLTLSRSGAVTFLSFCYPSVPAPTPSGGTPPTPSGGTQPTPALPTNAPQLPPLQPIHPRQRRHQLLQSHRCVQLFAHQPQAE